MRFWQKGMIFLARNKPVTTFMQNRASLSALATSFVGGRNAADAIEKAGALKAEGYHSSLFYLGEYVEDPAVIHRTVDALKDVAAGLGREDMDVHISVDPTQIGYQIDKKSAATMHSKLPRRSSRSSKERSVCKETFSCSTWRTQRSPKLPCSSMKT